jgi:hypothetical protein
MAFFLRFRLLGLLLVLDVEAPDNDTPPLPSMGEPFVAKPESGECKRTGTAFLPLAELERLAGLALPSLKLMLLTPWLSLSSSLLNTSSSSVSR